MKPPIRNPGPNHDRYFRVLTDETFMFRSFHNEVLKLAFRWEDVKGYESLKDYYALFQNDQCNSTISLSLDNLQEVTVKPVDLGTLYTWLDTYKWTLNGEETFPINISWTPNSKLLTLRDSSFSISFVNSTIDEHGVVIAETDIGIPFRITFYKSLAFDPTKE